MDEKGNIWLEDWNSTLGARANLNSQIEAVYLFSKPKWQDTNWYIGKFRFLHLLIISVKIILLLIRTLFLFDFPNAFSLQENLVLLNFGGTKAGTAQLLLKFLIAKTM